MRSQFHLRAYCVASGALQVYLYTRILALFSSDPYVEPLASLVGHRGRPSVDMAPHLTNTSLQDHHGEEVVRLLEELIGCPVLSKGQVDVQITAKNVTDIINQMVEILAETFKAALETPSNFQVSPLLSALLLYNLS